MRFSIFAATATVLAMMLLALPAEAAHHHRYGGGLVSGGYSARHYTQGTPSHGPIWRYGYYQGNDPDRFIRGQIIRDPRNGASTCC